MIGRGKTYTYNFKARRGYTNHLTGYIRDNWFVFRFFCFVFRLVLLLLHMGLKLLLHTFSSVTQGQWPRTGQSRLQWTLSQLTLLWKGVTQLRIKPRFPPIAGSMLTTTLLYYCYFCGSCKLLHPHLHSAYSTNCISIHICIWTYSQKI